MNRDLTIKRIAADLVANMSVAEMQLTLMRELEEDINEMELVDAELVEMSPQSISHKAVNLVVCRNSQEATWDRIERFEVHLANGGVVVDFE
jgi:Uma2 family endonuclease